MTSAAAGSAAGEAKTRSSEENMIVSSNQELERVLETSGAKNARLLAARALPTTRHA
jgi:hypothetical protein